MLSKHLLESQNVFALNRSLFTTGKFTLNFLLRDLKNLPLNAGDCLIQVAFQLGLIVSFFFWPECSFYGTFFCLLEFLSSENGYALK